MTRIRGFLTLLLGACTFGRFTTIRTGRWGRWWITIISSSEPSVDIGHVGDSHCWSYRWQTFMHMGMVHHEKKPLQNFVILCEFNERIGTKRNNIKRKHWKGLIWIKTRSISTKAIPWLSGIQKFLLEWKEKKNTEESLTFDVLSYLGEQFSWSYWKKCLSLHETFFEFFKTRQGYDSMLFGVLRIY